MQLSGEVYQYAVIPRGIAACNRNFTFYQKKRLEPNPGKPRQITSYQKKFFTYFDFFKTIQWQPHQITACAHIFISFNYINLFQTPKYSNSTEIYSSSSSLEMPSSYKYLTYSDLCLDMSTPHLTQ